MTTSPSQDSGRLGAGDILAGKYRIERMIGAGGMGCVLAAEHMQLGQRVAIKTLLPDALQHAEAVERFLREARAAVRLRTEHVGRVIDVGTLESGAPYMVMEYLEGQDLAHEIRDRGCLPVTEAADYVLQACEAVAEAHAYGMVHRDLKPANLFLTRRPDGSPLIKVLDFGISKAAPEDQSFQLTRTNTVMGSPGYMSPEQLRSTKDVDPRSDIWALGVILYELVSGTQPFRADSFAALCIKVATEPAPGLAVDGLPPGYQAIVSRCLAKDPGDRYADVAELAQDLAAHASAESKTMATRVSRVLRAKPAAGSRAVAVPRGVVTSAATAADQGEAGQDSGQLTPPLAPPTTMASAPGMGDAGGMAPPRAAQAPARAAAFPVTTMSGASGQGRVADTQVKQRPWMLMAGVLMAAAAVSALVIAMTRGPGNAGNAGAPAQDMAAATPALPPDAGAAPHQAQVANPGAAAGAAAGTNTAQAPDTAALPGPGAAAARDSDSDSGSDSEATAKPVSVDDRADRRSRQKKDRGNDGDKPESTDSAPGQTPDPAGGPAPANQGTGTNTASDPGTDDTKTKDLYDTRY